MHKVIKNVNFCILVSVLFTIVDASVTKDPSTFHTNPAAPVSSAVGPTLEPEVDSSTEPMLYIDYESLNDTSFTKLSYNTTDDYGSFEISNKTTLLDDGNFTSTDLLEEESVHLENTVKFTTSGDGDETPAERLWHYGSLSALIVLTICITFVVISWIVRSINKLQQPN